MGIFAALYGLLSYTVFLASFLYAIGFIAGVGVPKSIDTGPGAPLPQALIINLSLLGLFAVQHSVMARAGFKAFWTRIVPKSVERSTFVLISSLLLALICWQWVAMPEPVWEVDSPLGQILLHATFALGWVILLLSTFMISHFDLFGLRQVYLRWRRIDYTPVNYTERAFYKLVRHPLYLGFLIAFWATPHMSVGHLLFSTGCTGYILLGILLEERDLLQAHGTRYAAYRKRVPMLLPVRLRRD